MALHSTRGIVLSYAKHGESSLLVKIFTEDLGLHTFIVQGAQKKHSRFKPALFLPLSLLDLVVYYHESRTLHRLREAKPFIVFSTVHQDPNKYAILLFLSEVVSHSLHSGHTDKGVFAYISDSVGKLDRNERKPAAFHLDFLCGLAHHLGFRPEDNYSETDCYFAIESGVFVSNEAQELCFTKEVSALFARLLRDWSREQEGCFTHAERKSLLNAMMQYYTIHLPRFGQIRSLQVLEEIFSA